eukprot:jgi/Psemu1/23704/gm1.23704_g
MSQETDWIEPTGEYQHTVIPNTSTAENTSDTTDTQAERIGEAVQQLEAQIRRLHNSKKNSLSRHHGVQGMVMAPNALDVPALY